jgi:hypothetical protein
MSFKLKLTEDARFGAQPAPARGRFNLVGFVCSAVVWLATMGVVGAALYACWLVATGGL